MPRVANLEKRYFYAVILLFITAAAGIWSYRLWQNNEEIEAAIVKLNCSYALAIGENYKELANCIKSGEEKAETYSRIDNPIQKLEFLTDLCLSGSKLSLTASECKDFAWKILYSN